MELQSLFDIYREMGVPQDQQMLIALLREVQAEMGGTLSEDILRRVADAYGIRESMLSALIRRVPDLRMAKAAHRLEMCGTCRQGASLRQWVEETYRVKSGGLCEQAGFTYHVTPCMKNCKNGPSVRWDGELYSHADRELLLSLIEKV